MSAFEFCVIDFANQSSNRKSCPHSLKVSESLAALFLVMMVFVSVFTYQVKIN